MPKAGRGYTTGHEAAQPLATAKDIAALTRSDLEHRVRLATVWGTKDAGEAVASAAMKWARERIKVPVKRGPRRKK